jgi:hypothetical protein
MREFRAIETGQAEIAGEPYKTIAGLKDAQHQVIRHSFFGIPVGHFKLTEGVLGAGGGETCKKGDDQQFMPEEYPMHGLR